MIERTHGTVECRGCGKRVATEGQMARHELSARCPNARWTQKLTPVMDYLLRKFVLSLFAWRCTDP